MTAWRKCFNIPIEGFFCFGFDLDITLLMHFLRDMVIAFLIGLWMPALGLFFAWGFNAGYEASSGFGYTDGGKVKNYFGIGDFFFGAAGAFIGAILAAYVIG